MSVTWKLDGRTISGPSWSDVVSQGARELGFTDPDLLRVRGTDLQILEYFRIKNHDELAPLTNWLVREMHPPNDALLASSIHNELSRLDNCDLFYTTNFDDFIERSLRLHRRAVRVVAIEPDIARRERGECEIVKFHGDWNHPSHMVMSESDYERRLNLDTAMDYRLRADLLGRALLFIGYSFRDPNVAYLFRKINDQFRALTGVSFGRRAYIAVPEPSDFEVTLFQARNIEVIPIIGADVTSEIAELISDLRM